MGGGGKTTVSTPDNSIALAQQKEAIEKQNKLIEQQMEEARVEREKQKMLNQVRADEERAEKERDAALIKEQGELEKEQDAGTKEDKKNMATGNTDILDVNWLDQKLM